MTMRSFFLLLLLIATSTVAGAAAKYQKHDNGTVVDFESRILWQQLAPGNRMTWTEAQKYCSQLKTGQVAVWSLPTAAQLKQLQGNLSKDRSSAAIFSGTEPLPYWSGTEDTNFNQKAWVVDFGSGMLKLQNKKNRNFVRCMR